MPPANDASATPRPQEELNALLGEARRHGLAADREGPFLLWVGNEVWDGREEGSLPALTARAELLVARFKSEDVR